MTARFRHYRYVLPAVAQAALLAACASPDEVLNSDRIEQSFGSYGVEILSQDIAVRRTSLYSITDGERVCRTYAIVLRAPTFSDEIAHIHSEIVAGASIGTAFQAEGWTVSKETSHVGSLEMQNASHPIAGLMHLDSGTPLATHVYSLTVTKGSSAHHYATIVETHHPQHLNLEQLQAIYGEQSELDRDEALELYTLVLIDHWD